MGAIGTYIGGSLAAAGYPVSFVEHPETAKALGNKPLAINTPFGIKTVKEYQIFHSLKDAMKASQFDVALLAVKSFDTQSVLEDMRPFTKEFPTVLCLQNGVENEPLLEGLLGTGRVIGASIATAVGKAGPVDVFVEKMRGLGIESGNSLSASLIEAFNKADLKARGYANREDLKWSKMLTNLLGNATSAILNWTPAQIFADKVVYDIELRQIRETLAVMKARGIRLVNLPGTPIAPLIRAMQYAPAFISQPLSYLAMGKGRGNKMPSFHIDLYHGQTRSEVTYLNGAVVRAAAQLGLRAPVNQALTEILENLASGKTPKSEFVGQPKKLLLSIEAYE
jgi:2-dehydropantoate 2-reductase